MTRFVFILIAASSLPASAQSPRYNVTDLGTLPGGTSSNGGIISNNSIVSGSSTAVDGSNHAVLWQKGQIMDLGTPGLKGKNSLAWSVNDSGRAVGQADTATLDPNGEDFCGSQAAGLPFMGTTCVPFVWERGVMNPLPLLGGYNGLADALNNQGVAGGFAETANRDADCARPQVLQFKPVLWKDGKVQELPVFSGDTVGGVFGMNDSGQAVGASGLCGALDPLSGTYLAARHAMLWQNGAGTDLGNLGSKSDNVALAINNQGQVVGHSGLRGFLWTQSKGMQDLGTLPGDIGSGALSINDKGEMVGVSQSPQFHIRAVRWENGVPVDLNSLVNGKPDLSLLLAGSINSRGEIIGIGVTHSGDVHTFLATPAPRSTASAGPKNITVTSRQIALDGTASVSTDGKALTFLWSIPPGSPAAAILRADTAAPIVQLGPGRGVYTFQLTITDSNGAIATDTATINFQGN